MRIRSAKIKMLLAKAQESALLAVDVYNKPSTKFRSYGYIVLMNIAWTSLFHAIWEKRGVKYFYKRKNSSRYEIVDGERKAWDISKCVTVFYGDENAPERKNLEFFIGLRNKIEHRFLPALDLAIIGESQSLLRNFEGLLVSEFGQRFSLNDALAIPLHLLSANPEWKAKILKELQSEQYHIVRRYLDTYRGDLDNKTFNSPQYSFRVFLIPKTGNHENSSDLAIEFVRYDANNPEEMKEYERMVGLITEKRVQVPVVNPGGLKAGAVSKRVEQALGIKFTPSSHHVQCWKSYEVRPESNSTSPEKTNTLYCHYDAAHKDYVYTEDWVAFLITELSNPQKRSEILG
ncbi:MAG: DUF3644 domain-containing protein [Chloroflexota bacterium]